MSLLSAALGRTFPPAEPHSLYRCPACGHDLTYGAARCGGCNEEAPVYNSPTFWRLLWPSAIALVAFTGWVMTRM